MQQAPQQQHLRLLPRSSQTQHSSSRSQHKQWMVRMQQLLRLAMPLKLLLLLQQAQRQRRPVVRQRWLSSSSRSRHQRAKPVCQQEMQANLVLVRLQTRPLHQPQRQLRPAVAAAL
jgi:hypothetical protein